MYRFLSIENFKSIVKIDKLELGRVNVFIGANGSGKTNILEAVAMLSASKSFDTSSQSLRNKGARIARPNLTFNSFKISNKADSINIALEQDGGIITKSSLRPSSFEDIYSDWNGGINPSLIFKDIAEKISNDPKIIELFTDIVKKREQIDKFENIKVNLTIDEDSARDMYLREYKKMPIATYLIYNINTETLRGVISNNNNTPLGLYGEGLDVLLANLSDEEFKRLKRFKFIPWLKEYKIDREDTLKKEGHKLGHSKSTLYFVDKYMKRNNNIFSAENANEGALHILFYLTLMISAKTPSFFAIDNIDNTLNPRLCELLIKNIVALAKDEKINKQVFITTHNPASLDGLDLTDDDQRLFVVKRSDEGHTKVERIKIKPSTNGKKYNLSQLFMEDYLGGLNETEF